MKEYIILIPAYKPEALMLPFIKNLKNCHKDILVIDDGSGPAFDNIFNSVKELGVECIRYPKNCGKGSALKTGIKHIINTYPECRGIITADCDGQHSVNDILRIKDALINNPSHMIIGSRAFDKDVPLKSNIGNTLTRWIYTLATGYKIKDTQTGLRGFSSNLFSRLATLKGDRYEYEMNMLLSLKDWNIPPLEITIETIYLNNNSGSHYNPLKDSLRIGSRILLYMTSAFLSWILEYLLCLLLAAVTPLEIWISYIITRALSSLLNFYLNKKIVFKNNSRQAIVKYFILVLFCMFIGSYITQALTHIMPLAIAKPITDIILFMFNYIMQRDFVFKNKSDAQK